MSASPCPGCGLELEPVEGPTHPYMISSPACWALFGEVLAREYSDPARWPAHAGTVDAYAAQHPGGRDRRAIQSVSGHVTAIGLRVERGVELGPGRVLPVLRERAELLWLEPPAPPGELTVAHVHATRDADAHIAAVEEWGRSVWVAWAEAHPGLRDRLSLFET